MLERPLQVAAKNAFGDLGRLVENCLSGFGLDLRIALKSLKVVASSVFGYLEGPRMFWNVLF